MNAETPEIAVEPTTKVEPQTVATKPTAPKTDKPPKAKAKSTKVKTATGKGKQAKKPTKEPKLTAKAKAKAPVKTVKSKAKPSKVAKAKPVKIKKAVPQGKFPRHPKNPFREGSAYGQIFDAFVRKQAGIRRDELTKLSMDACNTDLKHTAYNLAVILSAKESNTGPRHPSCREGFWVKRDNDHLTLMID